MYALRNMRFQRSVHVETNLYSDEEGECVVLFANGINNQHSIVLDAEEARQIAQQLTLAAERIENHV